MDTKAIFDLAREVVMLEDEQKKIRTRVRQLRSLLGDVRIHGEKGNPTTLSGRITTYLQSRGGPIAVKEIADAVKGNRASVNASLWKLQKEGLLSKAGRGYYVARAS